jgi:hypothetical protein
MKKVLLGIFLSLLMVSLAVSPVMAAKPTTITINFNQAQDQWRGITPFGDWTPGYSYVNNPTSSDYQLTGNVLHTTISYSPLVIKLKGEDTVYVGKKDGLWIQNEGSIKYDYVPGYGNYTVENKWRGYIQFNGEPSQANFVKGVAYQWVYLLAPKNADVTGAGTYTANAYWDGTGWLVGFSIYRWDTLSQSTLDWPTTFPQPNPASNFNPLGL